MRRLSKSKILAYRQCPKRLWLEVHRKDLIKYDNAANKAFEIGHQVGAIAQKLFDPDHKATLFDPQTQGHETVFEKTGELLGANVPAPIFEAGFAARGAMAFADIMKPDGNGWHMIEVKSAAKVKDYYLEDTAIQSYIAIQSGAPLTGVSVAHIDSGWVYPGNCDYRGLLKTVDVSEEAYQRHPEVERWIHEAQIVANLPDEPDIAPGKQCTQPNPCGFIGYCVGEVESAEYPISWLPNLHHSKKTLLDEQGIDDLRDVPDHYLTPAQKLVQDCTVQNQRYFDLESTRSILSQYPFPAYFLDFETSNMAIPIWPGTRPYEQVPFQYSLHILESAENQRHTAFIDLSANNPTRPFAEKLITDCGKSGPIFVYNAAFESKVIKTLAAQYPDMKEALLALDERLVDLLPIAKAHHYHPEQQGSWSIKNLLPTIDPSLNYAELEGVQHGQMAMEAFNESIQPDTTEERREAIRQQLLEYCKLDTLAMVRIWEAFTGLRRLD